MSLPFSSLRIWLCVAALTTAAAFVITYRSIRQNEISNASVDHTQEVLSTLAGVESATGDLIFASSDEAIGLASCAAFSRIADLAALTADNALQQVRLQNLRGEIENVVRTRRGGGGDETATRSSATVPQNLSKVMRELRAEELALLTKRVETNNSTSQRLRALVMLVAVGSATFLVWVFRLVVWVSIGVGRPKRRCAGPTRSSTAG